MTYQQHPLSAAYPAMTDEEYAVLRDSIADIGVQNPITMFEDMVLDGWNRYRVTQELGYECPEVPFTGDDPVRLVRAQNDARRHLSVGARALIEVRLREWKPRGSNQYGGSAPGADAPSKVAADTGFGVRTIERAKAVDAKAIPEVQDAVLSNRVSLKAAEQIAKLPAEEQSAALKVPRQARKVQGKPKKVPASKWVKAEIEKADAKEKAEEAEQRAGTLEQANQELLARIAALEADNASMAQVFEANDQVAQALAEAKRLRELNAGLNARVQSMLSEIAALKRTEKALRKKLETPA